MTKKERAEKLTEDIKSLTDQLEEIQSELGDWRDNLPENLQQSSKYDMIDDAATELECHVEEIRDACGEIINMEWPS